MRESDLLESVSSIKETESIKTEKKNRKSDGLTRREFLSGAAALGILELVFPGKSLADLGKVLDYEKPKFQNYSLGIRELHEQVYQNNKEQHRFFIKALREFEVGFLRKTKTKSCWYEGRGSKGGDGVVMTSKKSYDVLLEDTHDLEEVRMVHTHPYSSNELFFKDAQEARLPLDKEIIRPIAFSGPDIINALKILYMFPQARGKTINEAVEPTGVWRMKIDGDHEKIRGAFSDFEYLKDTIGKLPLEQKNRARKEIVEIYKKQGLNIPEGDVTDEIIMDFEVENGPTLRAIKSSVNYWQLKIFAADKNEREKTIQEAQEDLARYGIKVKYESLLK